MGIASLAIKHHKNNLVLLPVFRKQLRKQKNMLVSCFRKQEDLKRLTAGLQDVDVANGRLPSCGPPSSSDSSLSRRISVLGTLRYLPRFLLLSRFVF